MKTLTLQSERYAALGNLASEGVKNQLGRPRLDQLTVLVRESVQNSWDAHSVESPWIQYDLSVKKASLSVIRTLRDKVFAEQPENLGLQERLDEVLNSPDEVSPFHLIMVSDRQTSGLGGPTRADVLLDESKDESHDFVDFLRNIGQPPDKGNTGGTFGYGKAALYAVSAQSVILTWTQCRHQGRTQKRLFVTGLAPGYTVRTGDAKGRYTGRHWWGEVRNDLVEPLLDEDAQALADELGLPGFEPGVNGTTIVILDADFGLNRTAKEAVELMSEALLWNFWPKMVRDANGRPPIEFTVALNGEPKPLPNLDDVHPLAMYADAYRLLKARRAGRAATGFGRYREIWCQKPKVLLGSLALSRGRAQSRKRLTVSPGTGGVVGESCHHVALMRDAELVVKYLEGPALQAGNFEYGGVFISHRDVDHAYSAAEPPTHDDWVVQNMRERGQRTLVRVGLRRINEEVNEFASPTGHRKVGGKAQPLGQVASVLGTLLTGSPGTGAEVQPARRNKTRDARKAKVKQSGPVFEEAPELPFSGGSGQENAVLGSTGPEAGDASGDETGPAVGSAVNPTEAGEGSITPQLRIGSPRARLTESRLAVWKGLGTFQIEFELKHGKNSRGTRLEADVVAELDGKAREKEPPAGAEVPRVLAWLSPDGEQFEAPIIEALTEGQWTVVLSVVEDTSTRASVIPTALEKQA